MNIGFLKEKIAGEIPVTREELLELISSWGRTKSFTTSKYDFFLENKTIDKCKSKECYDLSNLDVSNIINMSNIFEYSLFNGDISNWNTSNVFDMSFMFKNSIFNGDLSKWNVAKVETMRSMFQNSQFNNDSLKNWNLKFIHSLVSMFESSSFNGDISSWKFTQYVLSENIFKNNANFLNTFNNGEPFLDISFNIKNWLNDNREKIINIIKINQLNLSNNMDLDLF